MSELAFPPGDCVVCGRCCFSENPSHVRVFQVDLDRMSETSKAHVGPVFFGHAMRMEDGRCTALTIDTPSGRYLCSIYAERPDVCRSLVRASSTCLSEFQEKAGKPDVLLQRLRAGV